MGSGRDSFLRVFVVAALAAGLLVVGHGASASVIPPTTQTFNYTGAQQDWVVPAEVTRVKVTSFGAEGGSVFGGGIPGRLGGKGGEASETITVTPGETLHIFVGGAGAECHTATGGFNGGGNGSIDISTCGGGGGGGASDVRQGGTALANRVVVAGGGGGAANQCGNGCNASGGAGGGLAGEPGKDANGNTAASGGGQDPATTGSHQLGDGGNGGATNGGGGGGGYVGGAGGNGTGGGGGSGYPATATFQTGVRSGDGQVLISYGSPAFTSADNASFSSRAPGSFTVTTTGTPDASLSVISGTLPTNVTFTNNGDGTATIEGTPPAAAIGSYPLQIAATNGIGDDAVQNFTLNVTGAPAITSDDETIFTVGSPGTFTVTTGGTPNPAITETGSLPSGVTFVDNGDGTGTLSGTPAVGTGGTYSITFTAKDNGAGPDAPQSFTLTVHGNPTITSANSTTFDVGVGKTFTVTTSGFPVPALSETGTLPSGITFTDKSDGTATLAGTADNGTAGAYPISIKASNGIAPDDTQSFTLTVQDLEPPMWKVPENEAIGVPGRTGDHEPPNAIDGDLNTFTYTTPSGTCCGQAYLEIGFDRAKVDRIREFKVPENGQASNEVIQYTNDTGDLASRSWTNVTNLQNGFHNTELLNAASVNTDGTIAADAHDSFTNGFASLTFDPVVATGVRIGFTKVSGCCNHFQVYEFETYAHAPSISTTPSSPSNDDTPVVGGHSEPGSTVSLYTGATPCTDLLDTTTADGNGGWSYAITTPLQNGTTTPFSATATDAANNTTICSDQISYVTDQTGPAAPTFDPPSPAQGATTGTGVTFGFSSSDGGLDHFVCTLDGTGVTDPCTTNQGYSGLLEGPHHFEVYAVDTAGNPGSAASRDFTVDATGPTVTITGPSRTFSRRPKFTFTVGDATSVVCTLDGQPVACTLSGYQPATRLKYGTHTLTVYGIDQYGNQGPPTDKVFKVKRRRR